MKTIADRFELVAEVSVADDHSTYRGRDTDNGAPVFVWEFELGEDAPWPSKELFAAATAPLLTLEHRTVPRYLAAATADERAYLVQEFVDGPTLQQLLGDGKRWTEDEAIADGTAVLEALVHLHGLPSPLIHGHVSLDELARKPDGQLALLGLHRAHPDAEAHDDVSQVGRALVSMLTGRPSDQVLDAQGELQSDEFDCAVALVEVMRRLVTTHPSARYPDAKAALEDLRSVHEKTAPLRPPPVETAVPVEAPEPDLAHTAPLAAPKPVGKAAANDTAPLAAPKPVPSRATTVPDDAADDAAEQAALYLRRTKNFPKWSVVDPTARGEFLIEFELRDVEERRLEVSIVDKLERLELRTHVNRTKREAARKKRVIAIAIVGAAASIAMYLAYAPVLPLVIVATLAGVAGMMLRNDEADESPEVELIITPEDLKVTRRDEFRARVSPRDAHWRLDQNTDLVLVTEREIPVLELSRAARMQADWFWVYIQARCEEIGSRRSHPKPTESRVEPTRLVPVKPVASPLRVDVRTDDHAKLEDVATEEVPISEAAGGEQETAETHLREIPQK